MQDPIQADQLSEYIGKSTGVSDWILVDQERINLFADVTEDHQFIHIDPEKAAETPFGGTIAHGFLTLSLLSRFAENAVLVMEGCKMGVNYGFEKVRMMSPVRAGKKVRGHFTLMSAEQRLAGQFKFIYSVKVEIEGEDKPALMAEWVTIQSV